MFRRARRYVTKKFNTYLSAMTALAIAPRAVFLGAEAYARVGGAKPQDSETRDTKSLNGVWNFRVSPIDPEYGFKHYWYKDDLSKTGHVIDMVVPSSYNDITQDAELRDHVGLVWYDKTFYVPQAWMKSEQRVWLRFESVHYAAQVWVNGKSAMYHEIGRLPFEQEITMFLKVGQENRITVACDNTLLKDTVPQGSVSEIQTDNGTRLKQLYTFDFFNYAGIESNVWLYTTPTLYVDDVILNTNFDNTTGVVKYTINYGGYTGDDVECYVEVLDDKGEVVANQHGLSNTIVIKDVNLWWPIYMHDKPGYLYTMAIHLSAANNIKDVYRQTFGIRTIKWDNKNFYINNAPVYFRGFGKHQDSAIKGKGFDPTVILKDFNLIDWVGANSFRTSHYPYPIEVYEFADKHGIMVIDECPSVDTENYSDALLSKHMDSLTELIRRDKNHPSVVMWSISNEPRTQLVEADAYFRKVANHVRKLDSTRPVTIALARSFSEDKVGQHLDIISFNRYNAWYSNAGMLNVITDKVIAEAKSWHVKYNKPVLMSEYGADTMEGLHIYPSYVWSEEFQVDLMSKHFKAFDKLRSQGFFIGEFIWNFADFKTEQTYTRVGGNKKGIFTRDREPKAGAFHLRKRYHLLAAEIDAAVPPDDLFNYLTPNMCKDEL